MYGKSSKTRKIVFWARAMNESGTYMAAESEPLKFDAMTYLGKRSQASLDGLLADLRAQGWEPLGRYGSYHWDPSAAPTRGREGKRVEQGLDTFV